MLPHAEIKKFQYGALVNYKTEKPWRQKQTILGVTRNPT
jgi:hypothetical protein